MANVNDALLGTYGTPSNTNRYVTDTDPRLTGGGTVTEVTGTAPIVITGTPTTTPNVTLDPIADANVSASAAIARSKLAAGTAYHVVVNDSSGVMSGVAPGSAANVLVSDGTSWVAAQETGQPVQHSYLNDGLITGYYQYAPHCTATGTNTGASTGNMRAVPITFGRGGTIDKLGVNMAASVANSVGRVGLYLAGSNGYPSTLIGESGALTLSGTTGPKLGTGLGIVVSARESYWLAFLGGTAAPNLVTVSTSAEPIGVIGSSGSGTLTQVQGITVAQAYGAMPGTFPSSATAITTASQLPLMLVGLT